MQAQDDPDLAEPRDPELAEHLEPDLAEQLDLELLRLRRGGGVYSARLGQRLGPRLTELLALAPGTDEAILRPELARLLDGATGTMDSQTRAAVMIALGVTPTLASKNLSQRLEIVADRMERGSRTAQRVVKDGSSVMARVLAEQLSQSRSTSEHAPPGWIVDSLVASLSFLSERPTLHERRTIVASTSGLSHVVANLTMTPRAASDRDDDLQVTALSGCTVEQVTRVSASYWTASLALPRPLQLGEHHTYEVTFAARDRDRMQPCYGFNPFRSARFFSAVVTFASPDDVEDVWAVDGVPLTVATEAGPTNRRLTLDPENKISCVHRNLAPGMCYGLLWTWATAEPQT